MKSIISILVAASFGLAGDPDTIISRKMHTDAHMLRDREVPASDTTQTIWIRGKDQMRIEDGDRVTIVCLDEKKMHLLNTKEKTASTVELPFDLKKYLPEGMEDRMPQAPNATVTVAPTTESKKVKDWNATKYSVSRSGGFESSTELVWASKDAGVDGAAFRDLMNHAQSVRMMGGGAASEELKKIEGVIVLIERTRARGEDEIKSREEIVSIERKEAPAGAFDIPADYEKKPFDMRAMGGRGGRGGRGGDGAASRRSDGGRGGAASKPADDKKPEKKTDGQ